MMKTTFLSLSLAAALIGVVTLQAQPAGPFAALFPRESGAMREIVQCAVRHGLNFRKETPLTDEQREQVKGILEDHRADIQAQAATFRDARRAMQSAVRAHGADAPETAAAADAIGSAARERALLVAKVHQEVYPILTPEQRERLEAARDEVHDLVDASLAKLANP